MSSVLEIDHSLPPPSSTSLGPSHSPSRPVSFTLSRPLSVSNDHDHDSDEYEDDDTISDLSFDEENYYNKDEIITAVRTSSFQVKSSSQFRLPSHSQIPSTLSPSPPTIPQQLSNNDFNTPMKLGMFRGVLLPCLQSSMFGALLFVKLPFMIGKLGVYLSIVSVIIAVGCTILTLLSLVALATNGKFKKSAGVYVLVRKHLGLELGGCIGLLHLAQKIGVTSMYCLAASEVALTTVGFNQVFSNKTTVFAIILCAILSVGCFFPNLHKNIDDIALAIAGLSVTSFVFGTLIFVCGGWSSGLGSHERKYFDCVLPHTDTFNDPRTGTEALVATTFVHLLPILFSSVSGVIGASTRSGLV
jgi:hypothetical protein